MLNKHIYRALYTITSREHEHIKPLTIFIRAASLDEAISESKEIFNLFVKDWGLDNKSFTYTNQVKLSSDSELKNHCDDIDETKSGRTLN